MSDRRMICLLLALASLCVLLYAQYDITFGPRLTTQVEELLGLPHLFVAVSIVLGAVAVLIFGLTCVSTKEKKRDSE